MNLIETFNEDAPPEAQVKTRWAICPDCNGEGHNSRHLGDVTQWLAEDPDAIEDYMGGMYDQRCDECDGTGKHLEVDRTRTERDVLESWEAFQREEWEYRRECEMERRMGA